MNDYELDICAHCNALKRCYPIGAWMLCEDHKNLKQYQPKIKKREPIKARSQKRAKQELEYAKLRKEFLEFKVICEVKGCRNKATEVHHKVGRVGVQLNDVRDFLAVCNRCHQHIENNPAWAKEHGYSGRRLNGGDKEESNRS